jgi:hypothetical protein
VEADGLGLRLGLGCKETEAGSWPHCYVWNLWSSVSVSGASFQANFIQHKILGRISSKT